MIRYQFLKRILDITFSLLMINILWPVFILIAVSIILTSKGRSIFKQQRVGKNGKLFTLYKFRTINIDVPQYASKPREDDCRINKVGRFLRKSALDELPQIFNVLQGKMSLVGPRPEMPFIVENYTNRERERLEVKPGITGLWQISGKSKEPIHNNLEYDLNYIKNQSVILDLKILIKTSVVFLKMLYAAFKEFFAIKIKYPILCLFLLWFCHLLNNYIWLKLDINYLTYDAHRYFMMSLKIFDAYKNFSYHILTDFIKATQLQPPLVGILTAPFYFVFGIAHDKGVMINAAIFLAMLIFSTYKLGEKLLNKKAGLLSAFLVTMYPVVFNQLKVYMLDLPLAAFVTLSIYFLLMTDNFRNFKYSVLFGISCGLGMLVKYSFPLFIVGPFSYIIIRNILSFRAIKVNNSKQLLINPVLSLTLGFLISFPYYLEKINIILTKANFTWVSAWPTPVPESNQFLHILRSLLWYLWGLINWQVSFFYFLVFITGLFFCLRTPSKNKGPIYLWILVSWVFISCYRYSIGFNMEVTGVRYTMPLLPAAALISAIGIMEIPFRKTKIFSIVIVVIFGIFQLLFISYPMFKNWSSKEIVIPIRLPKEIEKYKMFPESIILFSLRPLVISGSSYCSHPTDARIFFAVIDEIVKIIDSSRNRKEEISIFVIPDNAQLWYLQYKSYVEKSRLNFICDWNSLRSQMVNGKEKTIRDWILTSDYIIDKDGGILGEDYVLGDVARAKLYFNQNKDKFTLLSKVRWPDDYNILVFKRINTNKR